MSMDRSISVVSAHRTEFLWEGRRIVTQLGGTQFNSDRAACRLKCKRANNTNVLSTSLRRAQTACLAISAAHAARSLDGPEQGPSSPKKGPSEQSSPVYPGSQSQTPSVLQTPWTHL